MSKEQQTYTKFRLLPVEVSLLAYLFITFGLLCYQKIQNNAGYNTIIQHTFIALSLILIALLNTKKNNHLTTTLRVFFPLIIISFLYTETDLINNILFNSNLDSTFAYVEQWIFNCQPALTFSTTCNTNLVSELMYFGYFSYYLLIGFVPMLVFIKYGTMAAQKVVFIIIQSFLWYYLIFIIIPVAGPQYYFNQTHTIPDGYVFSNLVRFIQLTGEAPTAAFPSSHVAMCLILVHQSFKAFQTKALWLLPTTLLLILSTVYIQAHYVIDIIAAFITAPLIYWLTQLSWKLITVRYESDYHRS